MNPDSSNIAAHPIFSAPGLHTAQKTMAISLISNPVTEQEGDGQPVGQKHYSFMHSQYPVKVTVCSL